MSWSARCCCYSATADDTGRVKEVRNKANRAAYTAVDYVLVYDRVCHDAAHAYDDAADSRVDSLENAMVDDLRRARGPE